MFIKFLICDIFMHKFLLPLISPSGINYHVYRIIKICDVVTISVRWFVLQLENTLFRYLIKINLSIYINILSTIYNAGKLLVLDDSTRSSNKISGFYSLPEKFCEFINTTETWKQLTYVHGKSLRRKRTQKKPETRR